VQAAKLQKGCRDETQKLAAMVERENKLNEELREAKCSIAESKRENGLLLKEKERAEQLEQALDIQTKAVEYYQNKEKMVQEQFDDLNEQLVDMSTLTSNTRDLQLQVAELQLQLEAAASDTAKVVSLEERIEAMAELQDMYDELLLEKQQMDVNIASLQEQLDFLMNDDD